jgi:cytochrome c-type biogenesis protein CcmF
MIHEGIGNWGHLFVIVSFVSSLAAAIGYFLTTRVQLQKDHSLADLTGWKWFSRLSFGIHTFSVFGVIICLYTIISNHYFEYHYAWSHSSRDLPWYYMISCFWEGQEGSFLLWIFWHVLLGAVLIKVNKTWEAPLLTIFCLVQAFLTSMILGTVLPGIELKIGSSPFILLKDFMGDIPVYRANPNFVPEDGTGLNLLLQNYWMVIHPPTLFLGFAATLVPFSYCISGLWFKRHKEWVQPALPWALFAALILGTGILMGAYWAYETLNFGGYWNWDPVENAVYVPWLILVASIHTMISYKNSHSALKASVILVITAFILILYSTYLTRSGVLGESSVHSFTDLGLKNQLFIYLSAFSLLSLFLVIKSWKHIPGTQKEVSTYSREFWVFIGVTVLCLAAFQVILPTSIPFFNSIIRDLGFESNMAPPADQEIFYSNWQIWFAMLIAFLSGMGQFFWWKKMDKQKLLSSLVKPVIVSLLLSTLLILTVDLMSFDKTIRVEPNYVFNKIKYILLWTLSIFSIVSNGKVFLKLVKSNVKLTGGAITHMGMALMLLGILFSSGYSKVISINHSGLIYSKDADNAFNTENILLWRGDPTPMRDYTLTYKGSRFEVKGFPGYADAKDLFITDNDLDAIVMNDLVANGKTYYSKGDTVAVHPENTYFEVEYTKIDSSEVFTLFPRIQSNETMGKVVSPDIRRFATKDFYTHITSFLDEENREWSDPEEFKAKVGDTLFINDFIVILNSVNKEADFPIMKFGPNDGAITAHFTLFGKNKNYELYPKYIFKIGYDHLGKEEVLLGHMPEVLPELGLQINFMHIDPQTETFTFTQSTTQKDFIILKVVEKPLINLLWIGTIVLVIGIVIAMVRRYEDFVKSREAAVGSGL